MSPIAALPAPLTLATLLALLTPLTNAQTWQQQSPGQSPPSRYGHRMVFDAARQQSVLFGGYDWASDQHFQDTWTYDGQTWSQNTSPVHPSARRLSGMCYDEQRGVVVLFGGYRGGSFGPSTYFGDTWEFDGTTWQQVTPLGPTPSPRFTSMTYDAARGKVVLWGGYGPSSPYQYDDTWEYDGVAWMQRPSTLRPPAMTAFDLAFDRARGVTVLHQGYVFGNPTPMQTWQWDGTDWSRVITPSVPPTLSNAAMAYDEQRSVVLLFGSGFAGPAETYRFDGVDWQPVPGAQVAGTRTGMAIACDRARGAMVMFGGEQTVGAYIVGSDETWELATWADFATFGASCAAAGPAPSLDRLAGATPRSGSTFVSRVSGLDVNDVPVLILGTSDTAWAGTPLPLELSAFGLPGCQLLVDVELALLLNNQGTQADWALAVPSDPALHGFVLFEQSLVFGGTLQARAVSNAAALTLGL